MKKNGFTLVELIASIILLGLIIGITVVAYDNYVDKSERDSFNSSLNGLIRTLDIYAIENPDTDYTNETDITSIELDAEFVDTLTSGTFKIENNRVILNDVTDGNFCGNGYKNNLIIESGEC